ncbi:hypothetical protein SADUNF_Sadunf16G0055800 [Salix dunnii]|uniref:Fatty acyl-CoA reductase n=1 Tax=Salix dunnii TaxID=1413687 RepID=A0A835J877_9ROSI|nr:hypothetical protein SADUNF_Sadunf16G0055800 [Salix dunnii]
MAAALFSNSISFAAKKSLGIFPEHNQSCMLRHGKSNVSREGNNDARKRMETAQEKSSFVDADIFNLLKLKHGRSCQDFMLSKLVPVVGNVCGSDIADVIAREEVDIIANSSAHTNFDESLELRSDVHRYDVSVNINTRGSCNLMEFAKKGSHLKLFLHVSSLRNMNRI